MSEKTAHELGAEESSCCDDAVALESTASFARNELFKLATNFKEEEHSVRLSTEHPRHHCAD